MKMRTGVFPVLLALAITGCGQEEEAPQNLELGSAEQDQMPMGGMAGMPAMGGMQSSSMMQQMQSQMGAMMSAEPDSAMAMMPGYRQMAANMLAQMNREMGQMNMEGDAAWNATADSVRQDLTQMPEITSEEMASSMAAHQARMNRLMEMHRSMMGAMQR